jgi:UDP-N-acetylglucosamine 2-epimerase (non-hydrolysing)
MRSVKVLCVVGTRPEAIKMAPVINALKQSANIECRVLATAQHRELLDQVLGVFGIIPDIDLDVMRENQSLPSLTARLITAMDDVLQSESPDAVLAQGDTTTVLCSALACFYRGIPFGHVEAGLRTWNFSDPFPEEMNRVLAGRLARWHFAPTQTSRLNLLKEGIPDESIFVTGNTVIDALMNVAGIANQATLPIDPSRRLILVTAHRRESFGPPLYSICNALRQIADRNPDVEILYPVHPNPNVEAVVHEVLGGHPRIVLSRPLDYVPFVAAMNRAYIILSDSGGVQEEAPALGKPVLVLRNETERPEAVALGVVKLVGTKSEVILENAQRLLDDRDFYVSMARGVSPYGDGKASERIVRILRSALGGSAESDCDARALA